MSILRCPKCGSDLIEKNREYRLIGMRGMSVKGMGLKSVDIYRCKACGYRWED